MHVHDLILHRHSALAFSPEPLNDEIITSLFEAARWAPSSSNLQPWLFIYAKSSQKDFFHDILSALDKGNQIWAKNASLLVVTLARTLREGKNQYNVYAWHDCGLALQNLLLQAAYMGLAAHPMGGFDRNLLSKILQIPPFYELVTVTAIGFQGNVALLPEHLYTRTKAERTRKKLEEIVKNTPFS